MTRKTVWRAGIALATALALASCDTSSNPSGLNTGELILQILGLSSGTNAAVTVTGPGGFSQNVTASGALANLTPGTYTITASSVSSPTARYDAAPATQNIAVSSNQTSNATVTYSATTGSL
ncbi:MAG TPA: hypothetical protein VEI06_12310, partial [Gemmatimonadaceae bacterium]|nr:hypothetical protein [Gemmatimonadaceae bacterium]